MKKLYVFCNRVETLKNNVGSERIVQKIRSNQSDHAVRVARKSMEEMIPSGKYTKHFRRKNEWDVCYIIFIDMVHGEWCKMSPIKKISCHISESCDTNLVFVFEKLLWIGLIAKKKWDLLLINRPLKRFTQ